MSQGGMRLAWSSFTERVKYPHRVLERLTKKGTSTCTRSSAKDIFTE